MVKQVGHLPSWSVVLAVHIMNEDEGGVTESDVCLTNFEQWLIQCLW